jgi:phosphoribosyl 1,2-cyclic phosphodiesterase
MTSKGPLTLAGAPSAQVSRILREAGYELVSTGVGPTVFIDDGSDPIIVTGAAIDALPSLEVVVISHRPVLELRMLSAKLGVQEVLDPDDVHRLVATVESVRTRSFSIRFWGVRGSIPCPDPENMIFGGNTSCVQISIRSVPGYVILDSGSGIRTLGNALIRHGETVHGHVFITHAHWDHIQGFPFFRPIYQEDGSLSIHMPRQKMGDCKTVLTTQFTPTYFPVTVEMLNGEIDFVTQEPGITSYDGFSVEFMHANHPVETAVYKFRVADHVIVYAPDNEITDETRQELAAFIADADVLIHDSNYDRVTYPQKIGWGHSAWEDVVELAANAGVKHLYLTHHDPTAHDELLIRREQSLALHRHRFKRLALAREGMVVRL